MTHKLLAISLMVALSLPQAAQAQDEQTRGLLHAVFGLWGMMDGAANFCWEVAEYDVRYMEAHQNWLSRNVIVRDELEATRVATGEPDDFAANAEAFGSNGIVEILKQAINQSEACGNWLSATDVGGYDAEVFMAEQLGLLRERDGM